jgi:hypothetical protein
MKRILLPLTVFAFATTNCSVYDKKPNETKIERDLRELREDLVRTGNDSKEALAEKTNETRAYIDKKINELEAKKNELANSAEDGAKDLKDDVEKKIEDAKNAKKDFDNRQKARQENNDQ